MGDWSEGELLDWCNNIFLPSTSLTDIGELTSGCLYVQIVDSVYPGEAGLNDVVWESTHGGLQAQAHANIALLRLALQRHNIPEELDAFDVGAMCRGDKDANLKALQFLHSFWESNYLTEHYDPVQRRQECYKAPEAPTPQDTTDSSNNDTNNDTNNDDSYQQHYQPEPEPEPVPEPQPQKQQPPQPQKEHHQPQNQKQAPPQQQQSHNNHTSDDSQTPSEEDAKRKYLELLRNRKQEVKIRRESGMEKRVEAETAQRRVLEFKIGNLLPEYTDLFSHIDEDGNGVLDAYELSSAFDIPFERCFELLAKGDQDGDNFLDLREFVELFSQELDPAATTTTIEKQREKEEFVHIMLGDLADEYKAIFQSIDANGNGVVEVAELAKAFKIPFQKVLEMVVKSDVDGDNALDVAEFMAFVAAEQSVLDKPLQFHEEPQIERRVTTSSLFSDDIPVAQPAAARANPSRNSSRNPSSSATTSSAQRGARPVSAVYSQHSYPTHTTTTTTTHTRPISVSISRSASRSVTLPPSASATATAPRSAAPTKPLTSATSRPAIHVRTTPAPARTTSAVPPPAARASSLRTAQPVVRTSSVPKPTPISRK